MKRTIAAVMVVAFTVVGASAVASAGEITGNGKLTPIKARQTEENPAGPANSACAFSGYNDGYADGSEPLRTQSFGTDGPSQAGGEEVRFYATTGLIKEIGPGAACRGGVFFE